MILSYLSILAVGGVLIYVGYNPSVATYKDVLINIGSDMIAVTIVFVVGNAIRERSQVPEHLRGRLSERASPSPRDIQRWYLMKLDKEVLEVLVNSENPNIKELKLVHSEFDYYYQNYYEDLYGMAGLKFLDYIDIFVFDCQFRINEGTLPSNPNKKLSKSTKNTLQNYINIWTEVETEVMKNNKFRFLKITKSIKRDYYKEKNIPKDKYTPIPVNSISKRRNVRIRSINRDFYQ